VPSTQLLDRERKKIDMVRKDVYKAFVLGLISGGIFIALYSWLLFFSEIFAGKNP
jgi:hypothetical protein